MKVIQRDVRIVKTVTSTCEFQSSVKVTGMGRSDLYTSILVDMVD